jgi:hypothetical protein
MFPAAARTVLLSQCLNAPMAKDYLKRELGQAFAKSSQVIALFNPDVGDNQFIIKSLWWGQNCSAEDHSLVVLWCESDPGHFRVTHALASALSLLWFYLISERMRLGNYYWSSWARVAQRRRGVAGRR